MVRPFTGLRARLLALVCAATGVGCSKPPVEIVVPDDTQTTQIEGIVTYKGHLIKGHAYVQVFCPLGFCGAYAIDEEGYYSAENVPTGRVWLFVTITNEPLPIPDPPPWDETEWMPAEPNPDDEEPAGTLPPDLPKGAIPASGPGADVSFPKEMNDLPPEVRVRYAAIQKKFGTFLTPRLVFEIGPEFHELNLPLK